MSHVLVVHLEKSVFFKRGRSDFRHPQSCAATMMEQFFEPCFFLE